MGGGTGVSRNYVAQDGDLEVGLLPSSLKNAARFVRVFPWRWTGKKGIADNLEPNRALFFCPSNHPPHRVHD